jgi:hypothetical protein
MNSWIWGLLLDGISLTSIFFLTRKMRIGWLISLFNLTVVWVAYAIVLKQWGFFPGISIHAFMAWRGWVKWGRTEEIKTTDQETV